MLAFSLLSQQYTTQKTILKQSKTELNLSTDIKSPNKDTVVEDMLEETINKWLQLFQRLLTT